MCKLAFFLSILNLLECNGRTNVVIFIHSSGRPLQWFSKTSMLSICYRPQWSCGKIMFLHMSVILFTGGCLCLGGLCPGGISAQGGSLSKGVSVQGGLCPGGSVWGVCPEINFTVQKNIPFIETLIFRYSKCLRNFDIDLSSFMKTLILSSFNYTFLNIFY